MKKPAAPPRPLVAAAEKLDASLAEHGRSARELARMTFDSRRNLEKAGEVISRIARQEQELSADMQGFVTALGAARDEQQADAERTQARALELVERRAQLDKLDTRLAMVGEAVKAIASLLEQLKAGGGGGLGDALGQLGQITDLAAGVTEDARAAGFADVADEAHAMRQQLDSVLRKAEALDRKVPRA
jgi:hypothetical protein